MPFVPAGEALNLPIINIADISDGWAAEKWRMPIVGSERCRVVLWQLPPGQEPHPLHLHPNCDEVMLILRGQGMFRVGDEPEFMAGPMSVVFAPAGVPHTLRVVGPGPLRWLTLVAPNEEGVDEELVSTPDN